MTLVAESLQLQRATSSRRLVWMQGTPLSDLSGQSRCQVRKATGFDHPGPDLSPALFSDCMLGVHVAGISCWGTIRR